MFTLERLHNSDEYGTNVLESGDRRDREERERPIGGVEHDRKCDAQRQDLRCDAGVPEFVRSDLEGRQHAKGGREVKGKRGEALVE